MRIRGIWAAALFVGSLAFGQEAPPATPPAPDAAAAGETAVIAKPDRPWLAPAASLVVNLPSDQTIGRGLLQFLVTHRFVGVARGSNAHSLYSIDTASVFGFGFSYAPIERGELSLYRSGMQDDWELAAKYALVPAGRTFGAALRVGGDDRRAAIVVTPSGGQLLDTEARTSFFAQAILGLHLWNNRVEISAVPSYSSQTTAEKDAFNVPFHAGVALGRSWNLQGEYQFQRKSVPDSIDIWAIGIEKTLYRHRFSLVISNSTATNVDQYLSGDVSVAFKRQQRQFANGFSNNDWHIGFNLTRLFKP
jgi:hypothetical protein